MMNIARLTERQSMGKVRIDKAIEVLAALRGLELEVARLVGRLDKKALVLQSLLGGMTKEELEAFRAEARTRRLWG